MITSNELWQQFVEYSGVSLDTPYDVWYFGSDKKMADELGQLVVSGEKRATASLKIAYDWDNEELPCVGEYSIITNYEGHALCIIKTTSVEVRKFRDVDQAFAQIEGEGDKSLTYWRQVHLDFFSSLCMEKKLSFNEDLQVVLEIFELVFGG